MSLQLGKVSVRFSRVIGLVVGALMLSCGAGSSAAVVSLPYSQPFNTDVASGSFATTYSEFTKNVATTTAAVSSGVLNLTNTDNVPSAVYVTPTLNGSGDITMTADVGGAVTSGQGGAFGIGFWLNGGQTIISHPGHSNFRVGDNGDGTVINTSLTYTPLFSALQHIEVVIDSSQNVSFTISGLGNDMAPHTFNYSFTADAGTFGGEMGLFRTNGSTSLAGLYDNFTITQVPEPSSLLLAAFAAIGVLGTSRRRRTFSFAETL